MLEKIAGLEQNGKGIPLASVYRFDMMLVKSAYEGNWSVTFPVKNNL